MQLPQELQHFAEPTLIVVADRVHAQFWLAHEENMEDVEVLEVPKEHLSDHEGRAIGQELKDDDRLHHLIHLIVEKIEELVREGVADKIHLVMEAELAHQVAGHVSQEVTAKLGAQVHADLMKDDVLDVVKRVLHAEHPAM